MADTGFTDELRRNILTGVAALLPILITLFLFAWLYRQIDVTMGRGTNALCRELLSRNDAAFRLSFPAAPAPFVGDRHAQRAYVEEPLPRIVGSLLGMAGVVVLVYLFGQSDRRRFSRVVAARAEPE